MGRSRVVLAIPAGLALLALALPACTRCGEAPKATARPASERPGLEAEIAALVEALETERERGLELSAEVSRLRRRLEDLVPGDSPVAATDEAQAPGVETAPEQELEEAEDPDRNGGKPWFDGEALLANGVAPREVERIRELFDASEMDLIRLKHRAQREGWLRSKRFWAALRDQRRELRAEIGDEAFDLLLFASGRNNRVVISDVLRNSPGERVGFEPGDVILSYADRRVFKSTGLRTAITNGRLGDYVPVDVVRGREVVRLYVPRGPIGFKLKDERRMPERRW